MDTFNLVINTSFDKSKSGKWLCTVKYAENPPKKRRKRRVKHVVDIYSTENKDGTCRYCKVKFENEEEHENYAANCEEKIYYCRSHNDCEEKFTRHGLLKHCKEYGVNFSSVRELFKKAKFKLSKAKRPDKEQCEICTEAFANKKELDNHYKKHDNVYGCEYCTLGFKRIMDYVCHMQTHSDDKLFRCPLCPIWKVKKHLLRWHIISTHDHFKKYECETCGKRFSTHPRYEEHVKYFHTGEKPFVCEECGKKFVYSAYLVSHKRLEHHRNLNLESVTCLYCPLEFPSIGHMQRHVRSQHPKSLLICDLCGKKFKTKENLRIHLRVHKGEKNYKCSYCDKRFITNGAKKEHERVHTGEKPFKCPYCKKGFTQNKSMIIHSRGHTGERPYVCRICSLDFTSRTGLVNHLKRCVGKDN